MASRAVKYYGFASPPQKFHKLNLGEKKAQCTLQTLCTYLTTSTDARWCITDWAKIFHCFILPYINQKFSSEIFLGVCGGETPLFLEYFSFYPSHPHPLKGGDSKSYGFSHESRQVLPCPCSLDRTIPQCSSDVPKWIKLDKVNTDLPTN